MRLRKSKVTDPGIVRIKHGRGFTYRAPDGSPLRDPVTLERIANIVIPPAWTEVWICPWPHGHIQAVGTDAAGRRQYRYHEAWTAQRAAAKFEDVLGFAQHLPALRDAVRADLAKRGMPKAKALAVAVRLLDLGFFRVGNESSAEDMGHFGLTTIRRDHVTVRGPKVEFTYVGKSGKDQCVAVVDPVVRRAVSYLLKRDDPNPALLAWQDADGWHDVDAVHVNERLHELTDGQHSAKDFRTWTGTVMCAVALAVTDAKGMSESGRTRAMAWAVKETSRHLGNTPTVCRASYVHPRLFDLWRDGLTVAPVLDELASEPDALAHHGAVEQAVLALLSEPSRVRHVRRTAA